MKTAPCFLSVMLMAATAPCAQFGSGHKSEEQIARMTPDQRVEEFCKEHARHTFSFPFHDEYDELLNSYLSKDGLKVIPQVIREIDAYDPTRRDEADQQKFRRYEAAVFILSLFEERFFRVRAFEEGRKAIEALKQMSERLRIAQSKSKEKDEYEMGRRYGLNLLYVKMLKGNSIKDGHMQRTLKIRYNFNLSDEELSAFVNYLIDRNPYYPSWSEVRFMEVALPDGKGATKHYLLVNPEPYHQAYLEYKAKK